MNYSQKKSSIKLDFKKGSILKFTRDPFKGNYGIVLSHILSNPSSVRLKIFIDSLDSNSGLGTSTWSTKELRHMATTISKDTLIKEIEDRPLTLETARLITSLPDEEEKE